MTKQQLKPGSVTYCDYKGFVVPEMIKQRPVIVVSKHPHHLKLLAVVPISTTKPSLIKNYHLEMNAQFCSTYLSGERSWVKCDMINVLSLDRIHLARDKKSGIQHIPNVGDKFLEEIKIAIKNAYPL
jgi:uncharacterized protein YifN (PemK superfamily)